MRFSTQRMHLVGAALLMFGLSSAQAAQDCTALRGCAAKFCHIENELAIAQAQKNTWKENGLRTALAEAKATCTDASLQQEREAQVKDKESKVQERQQELTEAQAKGKKDKIEKAQRKLTEAQNELKDAQAALNR